MADNVFISHSEADSKLAEELAGWLEGAGFTTWYHERDSQPGPDYLKQVAAGLKACNVLALIISPTSLRSHQVTNEIVRASEDGKPFMPLLVGISHDDFRRRRPDWRLALGAAVSIPVPESGISTIIRRIIAGIRALIEGDPIDGGFPTREQQERAEEHLKKLAGEVAGRAEAIFKEEGLLDGQGRLKVGKVLSRGPSPRLKDCINEATYFCNEYSLQASLVSRRVFIAHPEVESCTRVDKQFKWSPLVEQLDDPLIGMRSLQPREGFIYWDDHLRSKLFPKQHGLRHNIGLFLECMQAAPGIAGHGRVYVFAEAHLPDNTQTSGP